MVRVMTSINGDTLIYKEILIFVSQKLPEAFGLSPEQENEKRQRSVDSAGEKLSLGTLALLAPA